MVRTMYPGLLLESFDKNLTIKENEKPCNHKKYNNFIKNLEKKQSI
jgi:hypothetical protein